MHTQGTIEHGWGFVRGAFDLGTAFYAHLEVGATLMVMVYFERTLPP